MAKNLSKKLISDLIDKFVDKEATLYTDEYTIYHNIIKHTKILNHIQSIIRKNNMLLVKYM